MSYEEPIVNHCVTFAFAKRTSLPDGKGHFVLVLISIRLAEYNDNEPMPSKPSGKS